jgi:hypothetical protein
MKLLYWLIKIALMFVYFGLILFCLAYGSQESATVNARELEVAYMSEAEAWIVAAVVGAGAVLLSALIPIIVSTKSIGKRIGVGKDDKSITGQLGIGKDDTTITGQISAVDESITRQLGIKKDGKPISGRLDDIADPLGKISEFISKEETRREMLDKQKINEKNVADSFDILEALWLSYSKLQDQLNAKEDEIRRLKDEIAQLGASNKAPQIENSKNKHPEQAQEESRGAAALALLDESDEEELEP